MSATSTPSSREGKHPKPSDSQTPASTNGRTPHPCEPLLSKQQPENGQASKNFFARFATATARFSGSSLTFGIAVGVILIWGLTGPLFRFSDTWQLVINTGTTIITFLMVFLIQNTQNRDSTAIHLKLDELIRVTRGAHNAMINMEDRTQEDLDKLKHGFEAIAMEPDLPDPDEINA